MANPRGSQDENIDRIQARGLPVDRPGMCFADAGAGQQAFLVGDIWRYIYRKYKVLDIPIENFTSDAKLNMALADSDYPITALEVDAYFTTLVAYHGFDAIRNTLNGDTNIFSSAQDVIISARRFGSVALEKLGGLHQLEEFIYVFNYRSMANFLESFSRLCIDLKKPYCLNLLILSGEHAISLGYSIKIICGSSLMLILITIRKHLLTTRQK